MSARVAQPTSHGPPKARAQRNLAHGANAERVFRCEHGDAGASSYCATKFAVEGITECLAIEVAPLGIHVTVVEPGYFSTE